MTQDEFLFCFEILNSMNQTTDIYVQKVTESKQTAAKYHNCNRLPIWKIIENQDDSGYLGDFVDQVHKESKISKS